MVVLFKEGPWSIRETRGEYAFAKVDSVIYHECPIASSRHRRGTKHASVWLYRDELHVSCRACGKNPPESVQALWILHNVDKNDVYRDPWISRTDPHVWEPK
jgi:hypothetical protein